MKKDELCHIASDLGIKDAARLPVRILIDDILSKEIAAVQATPEGKVITTTKHPDGRRDVHIEVNMLDVKDNDPATLAAKDVIEKKIIPELANADVLVVVVHKPTNTEAHKMVKLPHVRAFAEAAIKFHLSSLNKVPVEDMGIFYALPELKDYAIVEHHITNGTVKISTL